MTEDIIDSDDETINLFYTPYTFAAVPSSSQETILPRIVDAYSVVDQLSNQQSTSPLPNLESVVDQPSNQESPIPNYEVNTGLFQQINPAADCVLPFQGNGAIAIYFQSSPNNHSSLGYFKIFLHGFLPGVVVPTVTFLRDYFPCDGQINCGCKRSIINFLADQLTLEFHKPCFSVSNQLLDITSEDCAICYSQLHTENSPSLPLVRLLPCNHLFHLPCYLPWISENNRRCPYCRTQLRRMIIPCSTSSYQDVDFYTFGSD